jgi:hypothetical protein
LLRHQDTITTGDVTIERTKEKNIGADRVNIDVVGVGGGVVDHMTSKGYGVQTFNSSEAPINTIGNLIYKNRRAEAYWGVRKGLMEDRYTLVNDREIIKELLNIRYFIKDKSIQIESKTEIKKRLGKSPDIADGITIAYDIREPSEQTSITGAGVGSQWRKHDRSRRSSFYPKNY